MIINSEGGVKQTIGQTTEYKTTIDIENLDFIATLLSSNLYSNPEDSFIREIVSNGWDSHVEAGNTNTPLLVRIKRNANYSNDITIRDYGTGLSKEQFENIYCKIGTSTKRNSNSFLGAFGIGKFSTMAVSKVAYITSYYNGTARLYIMTKDGNNITTNLVSEQSTDEHNGLEITVKNVQPECYRSSIEKLAFFPNVYIDGYFSEYNNIKIKRFKYFSFATNPFTEKILLGNVLYPLDSKILPSELELFYNGISKSGIVFNFNIGELNVTPNRESLIYNSKINELIVNRIKQAKAEIESILKPVVGKDYDNPIEYYDRSVSTFGYDFIENSVVVTWGNRYIPVFKAEYLDLQLTFCGKKVNPNKVYRIGNLRPLRVKAVVNYDTMWKDKFPWKANRVLDNNSVPILIMKDTEKISKYIKEYLLENHKNLIICNNFDYTDYERNYLNCYNLQLIYLTDDDKFVLQKCWEFMQKRFINIDFDTDAKFIAFRDELKKEAKANKVTLNEKIILHITNEGRDYSYKKEFYKYSDVLTFIKNLKRGVLFRNLDTQQIGLLANKLGYVTVAANKKIVDLLNKESLKCKISEDTIQNNREFIQYVALKHSGLGYILCDIKPNFIRTLPTEFQTAIKEAKDVWYRVHSYYTHSYVETITPNEDLLNLYNVIKNCYKDYSTLLEELNLSSDLTTRDLVSYIIMKNKMYKINYDCYKTIKESKLLKALCVK